MSFRIEKDTMGEVQVPADKFWGAQTERSRNNFKIGPEGSMPREIIDAFAYLKKRQLIPMRNWAFYQLKKEMQSEKSVTRFLQENCMTNFLWLFGKLVRERSLI